MHCMMYRLCMTSPALPWLVFDVETTRLIDSTDGYNAFGPLREDHAPLGITCAATLLADADEAGAEREARVWHAPSGDTALLGTEHADFMLPLDARIMADYLYDLCVVRKEARLLAFNGVSFDLRLLADVSEDPRTARKCRELAWGCYDPCFQVHCERGFPVGLAAMCAGMAVEGKSGKGADAPEAWASRCPQRRKEVLDYCLEDVRATHHLAQAISHAKAPQLKWISSRTEREAKHTWQNRQRRLLPCKLCVLMSYPDVSWMHRAREAEQDGETKENRVDRKPAPFAAPVHRMQFVEWLFAR